MSHFLDMGGYAAFVWPAYDADHAVVVLNIVWARRRSLVRPHRGAPPAGREGCAA